MKVMYIPHPHVNIHVHCTCTFVHCIYMYMYNVHSLSLSLSLSPYISPISLSPFPPYLPPLPTHTLPPLPPSLSPSLPPSLPLSLSPPSLSLPLSLPSQHGRTCTDGDSAEPGGSGRLRTVLEALASQAGFEIEFDDSSDSDDSEYNDEDDEGDVAVEGEGESEGREGEGERGGETDEKKEEIGGEGRERERENGKEGDREGNGEEEEKKTSEELETKEKWETNVNNNSTTIEVNCEEKNTEYDERKLTTHSGDSQTTAVTIDHSPSIDMSPETPSLQGSKVTLNVDNSCVEDSIETGLAGRETGLTGREASFTGRETCLTGREAGLTSREQVTPPQLKATSTDTSLCDDKKEGLSRTRDRDGKPLECTTESCNSSTRVDNTSTRAKSSSTRACGSGENDKQSSRGRSLLDLLTSSTALDSMAPPSSKVLGLEVYHTHAIYLCIYYSR